MVSEERRSEGRGFLRPPAGIPRRRAERRGNEAHLRRRSHTFTILHPRSSPMRRLPVLVSMSLVVGGLAAPFGAAPSAARPMAGTDLAAAALVQKDVGAGGFMSDNLTYVGTLPVDSPGVGARVVQVGAQKRL